MSESDAAPADERHEDAEASSESTVTVLLAGGVNLAIAAAKALGGLTSGSSAMLSEAAHSVADTVTEVLLLVALKRGARAADQQHPFGYGRESYLWAFMASLATFIAGAGFSVAQGLSVLISGESDEGSPLISYIVLAAAFVLEGVSFLRAARQVSRSARRWKMGPTRFLELTTDTTVKAVFFEDAAALIGLVLAAVGLALTHLTGATVWDGIASLLIGALLVVVAVSLARTNSSLLVGRSAPADLEKAMRDDVLSLDHVDGVPDLVTAVLGPGQLIVAAKVNFTDGVQAQEIQRVADEAERRFVARYPGVTHVYLDPTEAPGNYEPGADRAPGAEHTARSAPRGRAHGDG